MSSELARFDLAFHREHPEVLEQKLHWLAVHQMLSRSNHEAAATLTPLDVERWLRREKSLSQEYLELDEVRMALAAGEVEIAPGQLTPLTRLRLLTPAAEGLVERAVVSHMLAFLDPIDVGRTYADAPDLFFAGYDRLPVSRSRYFLRWLEAPAGGAPSTPSS
jgi:hypothetical protein